MRVSKALSPYVFFIDFDFDRPSLGYRDWRVAMQHFYKSSKEEELENFKVVSTYTYFALVFLIMYFFKLENKHIVKVSLLCLS
jgi:hypothetical protein